MEASIELFAKTMCHRYTQLRWADEKWNIFLGRNSTDQDVDFPFHGISQDFCTQRFVRIIKVKSDKTLGIIDIAHVRYYIFIDK